jgi:hypothetical protein
MVPLDHPNPSQASRSPPKLTRSASSGSPPQAQVPIPVPIGPHRRLGAPLPPPARFAASSCYARPMRLDDGRDMSAVMMSGYRMPQDSPHQSLGHAMLEKVRASCLAEQARCLAVIATHVGVPARATAETKKPASA